ncbi:MAG: HAMP domain-containing histidine kinase [Tissierellia bacterium]|nr:HAMP domain-containing histidine kinase [Tissierellia bacterium]
MKLSKRITLLFSLAILFSIFIVSLISNSMINNRFDKYLVGEQRKKLEQISKEINQLYAENEYKLYEKQIESYASLENLSIKIRDLENNLLYSSDQMGGMGGMHRRMMIEHGMTEGEYVENTFNLLQHDKKVGTLIIGYIDNSFLTESALIFKNTLTNILFIASIIAVIIGIITSILLSNSLTKPLINITNTSLEIQKGNLNKKSELTTNIIEIKELSNSINYLGETLSKQEDIRKKYASDISHELRTPLSTLKSHVEAIIDGIWEPSKEHLSILMGEIDRLSSLIDDLKSSFNSSEHGIVLNKTRFNLSDEIKEIIATFMPIFNKENISIKENIEKDIMVCMDKDKIKQVMYNLLSNSVKYIDKEGQIYISITKKETNKVFITVRDTGIGIQQEQLPLIFNRFYRIDKSRNTDTGGTGLGLAIVKSIVDEHGGEISVKSVYGKGSEFMIYLPIND